MRVSTISNIITKEVLNKKTGELEFQQFEQVRKTKNIRGGFRMVYQTYDAAVAGTISSKLDFTIVVHIRDMFTAGRRENVLSKVDLAKTLNVSEQKVSTVVRKMVEQNLLRRVSRGIYRLNPFMYVPYRADGSELQYEWNSLDE